MSRLLAFGMILRDPYRATLYLPNSDGVYVPCPANSVTVSSVGADNLPGALDPGLTFLSGMDVEVSPSLSGTIRVEFAPPLSKDPARLTVLHWDGAKWESLPVENVSKAKATTVGIFVLASK
jgi:hypothetical protein